MAGSDLVIRGATIIDGSGGPPFDADVAVEGGRIAVVGDVAGPSTSEIDGTGLVLAPGFVDTHTHDDAALLWHPALTFKLAQGCTTLVVGNCGESAMPATPGKRPSTLFGTAADWEDLAGFRAAVETADPACNAVALVGHNTVRRTVMGTDKRAPTTAEQRRMRDHVTQAMEQGACGLSTGLIYIPGRYSTTAEVVDLTEAVAPFGGLYATHMRNESDHLLDAVEEAIAIGSAAGVAVHISHHKAAGRRNWGKVTESLALVDRHNAGGCDVTLDVYPYTAGSGPMIEYFDLDRPVLSEAHLELAEVIRLASCPAFPEYEGRMLVDIATDQGVPVEALVRQILTAPLGDQTVCIHFIIDEADIETNLRHPRMMIGSDGIPDLRGRPHPRLFGTMPRVLGEYTRERRIMTLPEAVRRMTSLSCERFGIRERGRIREGWWADLVLFDAGRVADTATYDSPKQEPVGIAAVIVNGQVAYRDGTHTGVGGGRLLRFEP